MHLAELADADQLRAARSPAPSAPTPPGTGGGSRSTRSGGKSDAEPVADELVDVDARVEPDDVEPPERLGGPARLRARGERVVGRRRQQDLPGMGDGDEPGGACERRADRLVVAHLEIADSRSRCACRSFTTARAARTALIGSANTT